MQTRIIPRLLVASLLLAFLFAGASHSMANAKSGQADLWGEGLLKVTDWSETNSQEDVLVQSCGGFDIRSSYTANIAHHLTSTVSGDDMTERATVDFAGTIGNSLTGKSYAYDGQFTRWTDYLWNSVSISDLELRFEVGTPGEFTVAADRIEQDLASDPVEVIKHFVPHALQMELCYLIGGPNSLPAPAPDLVPSFDERMGKGQSGDDVDVCDPGLGYPIGYCLGKH